MEQLLRREKSVNRPFAPEYANNLLYKSVYCTVLGLWFNLAGVWVISQSRRGRADGAFLSAFLQQCMSSHTLNTLSVCVCVCVCVCASVLSPQLSQSTDGDPHLLRLKFLLSMTRDLEEEVREEIVQRKEIKYGKRYEA